MRKVKYLSPTSVKMFYSDLDSFYLFYLCDYKPPRPRQTQPMSIGSAFDAYVKSHLHERLYGAGSDPKYELKTLFEEQVEPHNRDWAWKNGEYVFKVYKDSGALADLALELETAIGTPRFEIAIEGMVSKSDAMQEQIRDVVLLGKPDLFFLNKAGYSVLLDWKVNGYCSNYKQSPKKGYLRIRHSDRKIQDHHKDAIPMMEQGMMINVAHKLEDVDRDWAAQLAIYGWLCGADIGEEFITCVDQLVCSPGPVIRVAQHRVKIGKVFQLELFDRIHYAWTVVHSDYIFRNMTRQESMLHCKTLDEKAKLLHEIADDDLFMEMAQ